MGSKTLRFRSAGLMFNPPACLIATGTCLVPTELSWRRSHDLTQRGYATVNPHHQRWLGRATLTPAGRTALGQSEGGDGNG